VRRRNPASEFFSLLRAVPLAVDEAMAGEFEGTIGVVAGGVFREVEVAGRERASVGSGREWWGREVQRVGDREGNRELRELKQEFERVEVVFGRKSGSRSRGGRREKRG